MYDLLGFCLTLAVLLSINVFATLLTTTLWRVLARKTNAWPAPTRAGLIFALRVMPAASAMVFVLALLLPSYLIYEPQQTNEIVSFKLALLAAISAIGIALAVWRGLAAWHATRRLTTDWLRQAEPLSLDDVNIPAYRIRHPFPVIAVVGILRPRLFVAHEVLEALSDEEFAAVVAHEHGHLAARDNLKRWVLRACRDVLMIVPCGRALDHAWAENAEAAADEHAARGSSASALDLASALVKIARMAPAGARPTMPAGAFLVGESVEGVSGRVRLLTQLASGKKAHEKNTEGRLCFALSVAASTILLSVAFAAASPQVLTTLHTVSEHIVSALN